MAGSSKRTSVILTVVAVIFIIVLIIILVIPDPCRNDDPRESCRDYLIGTAVKNTGANSTTTVPSSPSSTSTDVPSSPSSTLIAVPSSPSSTSTAVPSSPSSTSTSTDVSSTSTAVPSSLSSTSTSTDVSSTSTAVPSSPSSTSTSTDVSSTSTAVPSSTSASTSAIVPVVTADTTTTMPDSTDVTTVVSESSSNIVNVTENRSTTYETTEKITVTDTSILATTESETSDTTPAISETNATTTPAMSETSDTTTPDMPVTSDAATVMTETSEVESSDIATTAVATTEIETSATTTPAMPDTSDATTAMTDTSDTATVMTETTEVESSDTATTAVVTTEIETSATTAPAMPDTSDATTAMTDTSDTAIVTTETSEVESSYTTTTAVPTTEIETTDAIPWDPVCRTEMCKDVAARMLDIMDHRDVDPCEDFYQYSCGGVLDDHFLKPEDPQLLADILIKGALTKANRNDTDLEELLVVYDSCLNYTNIHMEDRLLDAQEVFNSVGYQLNDKFDLSIALAKMMKMHFTPFFDVMVDVDDKEKEAFVFKITLPAFKSPFTSDLAESVCYGKYKEVVEEFKLNGKTFNINEHYEDFVNCSNTGEGLKHRTERMQEALLALNLTGFIEDERVKNQLQTGAVTLVDFLLQDISKVLPSPPEIRKNLLRKEEYKTHTLRELNDGSVFPNSPIMFDKFFTELMGEQLDPDNTEVQVYFSDTLDEIFGLIYDAEDDVQNILLVLWAEHVYADLVKPIGPAPGSQDYCFNAIKTLMDDYVSYLYVENLPEQEPIKKKMETMIDLHKQEAMVQLEQSDSSAKGDLWNSTKKEFLSKLEEMTGEVARLESLKKDLPRKFDVVENNFVENYIRLMKHYRKRLYDRFETTPQDTIWSTFQFPYKSNGMYSYALNKFLIPHAAMSPPYYYGEEIPEYINAAGIGHMIAHELMHGFDTTGLLYNGDGTKKEMTQNGSLGSLVQMTECLSEKLNQNFSMPGLGINYSFKLQDDLSLNELLADSAATKLAWDTFVSDRELVTEEPPPQPTGIPARRKREADLLYAIGGIRNRMKRDAPPLDPSVDFKWKKLPYLEKTVEQLYYIKTAQNQCGATSDVDLVKVMEDEHMPPKLRVNLMLRNDPKFAKAFNCPVSSLMVAEKQCQFNPLGLRSGSSLIIT